MPLAALLLTLVAKTEDFSEIWTDVDNAIRSRYYARNQRKAEMEGLLNKYGPMARKATDRLAFGQIVNEMIRAFHDSHFAFLTESDQGYYLMDDLARSSGSRAMPEIGAWFTRAKDGCTVNMVLEQSEAEKAGLRKGDVITMIDGQPFTPVDSLKARVNSSATLTVKRGSQTLTPKVQVGEAKVLDMFLEASRNSTRVIEKNGRKIGYFHLWTQANNSFRDALSTAVYSKLRETDAFILDIRDGFGGRPEGYGDPFFRPEVWLDWNSTPTVGFRQLFGYQRPLGLLINGGSRSAKEVLSYIFKKSHRATLIGQSTAGNVLGTFPLKISDWAYIEIPIVDVLVDKQRLEANGVKPDIAIPQEFDENGTDMDLAAAIDRLSNAPKYRN